MATYFTSDLHFWHKLVAGLRGFWTESTFTPDGEYMPRSSVPDLEAHNEAVIQAFKVVQPDDIVWILGDVCINERHWPGVLRLIADYLPGRKRLICGNHDPVSSIHREAWKHQREALEVFETVQDFAKVRMRSGTVLLSHYPYSGTGSEGERGADGYGPGERYTEFRLTDRGTPLVHGHTHGPEKLHFSDAGTPEVHVGLDAWNMKLVPQHEVEKLLDTALSSARVSGELKEVTEEAPI